MKLTIAERLTLLDVMPKEGNYMTLKVVRTLQEEIGFADEEFKKYDLIQEGDNVRWDSDADFKEQKDVKIGEKGFDIICEAIKKLDNESKLKPVHMSLYEKFIENKNEG